MKARRGYPNSHPRPMWLAVLVMLFTGVAGARAQDATPSTTSSSKVVDPKDAKPTTDSKVTDSKDKDSKEEVTSKDTGTTFKLRVNLVQVRVVVRDSHGAPVDGLKREDFQVFDQGKLQAISTFGIETANSRRERAEAAVKTQQAAADESSPAEKVALPERFVALVYDDIHLSMQDAVTVRASSKALIESMTSTDRLGMFGTSGILHKDFTSDKAELLSYLNQIMPHPRMGKINPTTNCPDVNHYMADQYINFHDPQVLAVVAQETLQCLFNNDPREQAAATAMAESALQQALVAGDTDNDFTYRALEDVLRKLTGMPGERILVLASPGFLLTTQMNQETDVIDRANRASIVINTIDARGLYTPDVGGDISVPVTDTVLTAGHKALYRTSEQTANAYVLGDFADGTGGTFFHNSNDLSGGLQKAGAAPEVCYILGFSPPGQKFDGRFHSIKVALTNKQKYSIQARRGYYAPRKVNDPGEQAKQEIAEAVFSQDEIQELPLQLQTQYFKVDQTQAHLSVVSRIDLKNVHFRKADGRNFDNLTVATAIFDENGNYITGGEKILEMRLLDATFTRLSRSGLTMKSSFDVKPGKYLVRQVIRDSEGAQMAARNGAIVIPY
jgi:VWFA-related protein